MNPTHCLLLSVGVPGDRMHTIKLFFTSTLLAWVDKIWPAI